ncbi:MAG: DNA polymerase III subunit delta [bacterium]
MTLKYEDLQKRLKKGEVDPLYLFTGEEMYLIEEAIARIRNLCLTEEEQDANFHIFHLDDLKWDQLLSLAQTFPFIGKNRLVVLKGSPEKTKTEESAQFIQFLKKRYPSFYMIVVAEKVDQRTKLGQILSQRAVVVHVYKMFEEKVPSWIIQKVKESGRTISFQLAHVLAQTLGNDLSRIDSELTKVYLYMGKDRKITQDHLAVVSGESRVFSVFDLVKYMGEKKVTSSLRILDDLLEEGANPVFLLTMMVRQFRHISWAKSLMRAGQGGTNLARALGLPPIFARQVAEQAKMFSFGQLQLLYERFLETDIILKSSSCHPRLVMENLVMEVCRDPL